MKSRKAGKKLLPIVFGILFLVGISNAQSLQSPNIVSIGTQLNFPMSDFSNAATTGWGVTGQYEFHLGGPWNGTVTSGYLGFGESNGYTYSAVPLVVGTKLYFVGGWYSLVETGVHFFSLTGPNSISDSKTEWGFSVGTGYAIPLSENIGLDLSTKYQYNNDNLSYWNTYASIMFGL